MISVCLDVCLYSKTFVYLRENIKLQNGFFVFGPLVRFKDLKHLSDLTLGIQNKKKSNFSFGDFFDSSTAYRF